jgi:hypothetical protein
MNKVSSVLLSVAVVDGCILAFQACHEVGWPVFGWIFGTCVSGALAAQLGQEAGRL